MNDRDQKHSIQEALGLSSSDESNPMAKPQPEYARSKKIDVSKLSVAKTKPKYITVFDLDKELHGEFRKNSLFNNFYITGGVSGIKKYRWAWYFTLDDPKHSKVSMSAEIPYYIAQKMPFDFKNGMSVDIVASLSMSRRYGNTQIKVRKILPAGISDLYLKAQKTKRELAKAGCFDEDHKKPIPIFPRRVAVITSSKGAVIADIMDTVRSRFPKVQLVLFPSAVSGDTAPRTLIHELKRMDASHSFDVAIIGRGGGSKKDLQTFNNKQLALTIYHCRTPIISSVGHGIDNEFISNYVADDHEDTPTAAAEKVTPIPMKDFLSQLTQWQQVLLSNVKSAERDYDSVVTDLEQSSVLLHPMKIYQPYDQGLLLMLSKLHNGVQNYLEKRSLPIIHISEALAKHNPRAIIQTKIANSQLLDQHLQSSVNNYLQVRENRLVLLESNIKQINLKQIIINHNDRLNLMKQNLQSSKDHALQPYEDKVSDLENSIKQINLKQIIADRENQVKLIEQSLASAMSKALQRKADPIIRAVTTVRQLNPKQTMKRGFSFVSKDKHVINNAKDLDVNGKYLLNLYKGKAIVKILKRKLK